MKYIFLFLVFTITFSCTIQKRTVNKGYFVQWHWSQKDGTKQRSKEILLSAGDNNIYADSVENSYPKKNNEISSIEKDEVLKNEDKTVSWKENVNLKPNYSTNTIVSISVPIIKKLHVAKQNKTQKSGKAKTKLALGLTFLILALFLIIISFFAEYIGGLLLIGGAFFLLISLIFLSLIDIKNETHKVNDTESDKKENTKSAAGNYFVLALIFLILGIVLFFVGQANFSILLILLTIIFLSLAVIFLITSIILFLKNLSLK